MTVKSAPFYWLDCDRCRVKSTEGQEYVAWQEQDQAEDMARDSDWLITDDGHHYCPDCTTWDEDGDERVPLPPLDAQPTPPEGQAATP